jgi:hypothetical protein
MKPKLIFLTCTFNRPNITKIFRDNLLDIQNKTKDLFEFVNIVIDSDNSNYDIFKDHSSFIYHNHDNLPVSNKWNYGSSLCSSIDFDYIIIIGSDDILDESILIKYYEYMIAGYDFIGILDLYVYNILTDNLYYWSGYSEPIRKGETIGLGRCLSKQLVKKLNYNLWHNNKNKGLDSSMNTKINNLSNIKKITFYSKDIGICCDIKSETNITSFSKLSKKMDKVNQTATKYKKIKSMIYEN